MFTRSISISGDGVFLRTWPAEDASPSAPPHHLFFPFCGQVVQPQALHQNKEMGTGRDGIQFSHECRMYPVRHPPQMLWVCKELNTGVLRKIQISQRRAPIASTTGGSDVAAVRALPTSMPITMLAEVDVAVFVPPRG